ncbi:D-alanyl-D-alanine carboxypeptidase/D-alanyl-D-alanine-endopeptidase [Arcticibacter tournemirensis]
MKNMFAVRSGCLFILILLSISAAAQKISARKIRKLVEKSEILKDHFTGFALYDQDKNKMIYELNADKHFIPASNTKLFTFYTALNMIGDSIPGLRYVHKGDSLIFWGTGDPSLLHTYLKSTRVYEFLKNSPEKVFYAPENYSGDFFGRGWPLDNYNDYYQAEITALPLEDNVAIVFADRNRELQIRPSYLKRFLRRDATFRPGSFTVVRKVFGNEFIYPAMSVPDGFKQEIPWKTSTALTLALLQDTLKKTIGTVDIPMPSTASVLYSMPSDSVYRRMLLVSDNFMAEQLLLTCSSLLGSKLSTDSVITYSRKNFLNDLPDTLQWVDGSGLSRHNLFTPRSVVFLLNKIRDKVGNEERLHSLLPAGGVTGTLRLAYKTDNGLPFVWAKTGSLSNNHNQSGYLVTRKGRKLSFSFMNNNFIRPTSEIRAEMVRVITEIHNRF